MLVTISLISPIGPISSGWSLVSKEVSPILASRYTFQRFVAAAAAFPFFLLGLSSRVMIASSIELSSRVMIQQLSL